MTKQKIAMNKISEEFIKYNKNLIANAKTEDAISMLKNLDIDFNNEITMLSNRWFELKRQRISHIISDENYTLNTNKINYSILLLLEEIAKDDKKVEFNHERFISYKNEPKVNLENNLTIDSLILLNMFGTGWAVNECMAAVSIDNLTIDYITITGQSGMHEVNLISIGDAQENILVEGSHMNLKLSEKIETLRKWKSWATINREIFKKFLSKNMISSYGASSISWGDRVKISCNVFWGTRELFSNDENKLRIRLFEEENIQIIPFNRIGETKKKSRKEWHNEY